MTFGKTSTAALVHVNGSRFLVRPQWGEVHRVSPMKADFCDEGKRRHFKRLHGSRFENMPE
jgi:hypothetical protein